jgi:hypothetical protein
VAFLVGFLNFFVTSFTEITNICIIVTSIYPVDVVMNFVAVTIISRFDDFVYDSMRNEQCKKLIENKLADEILIIHHTTSKRCGSQELADNFDDEG